MKGLNIAGEKDEVHKFLQEKLKVQTKIEHVQKIKTYNNNKFIRVKLADWESKQKIREKKAY